MAKTKTEEAKSTQKSEGTSIGKIKEELGPLGFIGSIAGVIVLLGVVVVFFINRGKDSKNEAAQDELFQAVNYFEKDSLDLALNGDGRNLGFLSVIDIYGGTSAANLANFYAGVIYLKQEQPQFALDYLDNFSTSEKLVDARAKSLKGDAYMELGQFSDAAGAYESAANRVDDKFYSPGYLLKAALAYEKFSDYDGALKAVTKIVDDYFGASEYDVAKKHKARLELLASR